MLEGNCKTMIDLDVAADPDLLLQPLDVRCLALTGSFETNSYVPECFAGVSGDFNGRGLSLGVLQWNFGDGTLQPLLREMMTLHRERMEEIFRANCRTLDDALSDGDGAMAFSRAIQDPQVHIVYHPWRKMFKAMCSSEEFLQAQRRHAGGAYRAGLELCRRYGLWSERAAAMMFDVMVQNSGIDPQIAARIPVELESLPDFMSEEGLEVQKMRTIANLLAKGAAPRRIEDVRARKLCCANGRGIVHGVCYDLEEMYGIGLRRF